MTHRRIALGFILLLSACALSGIDRARVGVTTAVHVLHAAADVLESADQQAADHAVAMAQDGDPAGAQAYWDAWSSKYNACLKGLTVLRDAIIAASDAVEATDQGKAALNADNLLKALADLAKLFADAGLKLPAGVL